MSIGCQGEPIRQERTRLHFDSKRSPKHVDFKQRPTQDNSAFDLTRGEWMEQRGGVVGSRETTTDMNTAGERKCCLIVKETKERWMRRNQKPITLGIFKFQCLFLSARSKRCVRWIPVICGEFIRSHRVGASVMKAHQDRRNTLVLQIVSRHDESRTRWLSED